MATLKVLSAGAVKTGVAQLCEAFSRERGDEIDVEFTQAPQVRRRLAEGEEADVAVAPPVVMDELAATSRIIAPSRTLLGRSRMGIVVHAESSVADVPDVSSLKVLLSHASTVVYNKASSGAYAAHLLERLGIGGELELRVVVVDSGGAVMDYVAAHGPGTVGFAQIPEIQVRIAKGVRVRLAAPLPEPVQNVTAYEAAAVSGGAGEGVSRELAAYMGTPRAKEIFAATGVD
jgi:molybdate transport system substrate-binding protein